MSVTEEEKVAYFQEELERIYDHKIREFARLCLIYAPDYIFALFFSLLSTERPLLFASNSPKRPPFLPQMNK